MSGLRERKKWETRRRISDIATGLFLARGFDEVTVAEVAEAANVSRMTVFNYFPRKEDLFLDRSAEVTAEFTGAIRDRAAGVSVVDALRALHQSWRATGHPMSGVVRNMSAFWSLVERTPALKGRLLEQHDEFRDAIAEALREQGADELAARLAAGFLTTAHGVIFDTAMRRVLAGDPVEQVRADQEAVVDTAFDAAGRALTGLLPDPQQ